MSRLVSRILLAILALPLAGTVHIFTLVAWYAIFSFPGRAAAPFAFAGATGFLFLAGYWLLLWGWSVRWTGRRIGLTIAAGLGAIIVGIIVTLSCGSVMKAIEPATLVGTVTTSLLWLAGTILIWSETSAERLERLRAANEQTIVCPNCGYNLTGLTGTRCPECGAQYTMNELLALQPSKVLSEVES